MREYLSGHLSGAARQRVGQLKALLLQSAEERGGRAEPYSPWMIDPGPTRCFRSDLLRCVFGGVCYRV